MGRAPGSCARAGRAGASSGGGSAGDGVSLSGLVTASTVGGSRLVLMAQGCASWRELLPLAQEVKLHGISATPDSDT